MPAVVEIDGLFELRRQLNRGQKGASKAVGRAHKRFTDRMAARINARSDPRAVGKGRGSNVRGSAAQREAKIRVGGAHRADNTPIQQWGRVPGRNPRQSAPPRPYIRDELYKARDELYDEYLDELGDTLDMEFG